MLPALILLSLYRYKKLEDNFDFMVEQTAENVTTYDLVEVGFRILSLSLEDTMKKAEPFIQEYYSVWRGWQDRPCRD